MYLLYYNLLDPRTNDWLLVNSPLPTVFILIAYLYFVLNWGPKFMQNRKPFRLGKTLIVYNFFQVVLSTWLVYEVKSQQIYYFKYEFYNKTNYISRAFIVLYDLEKLQLALSANGLFPYI